MANWKKLAQGAAGAAGGGAGLNVEDVFSTYLYTGTGSNQTITNGIALADGVGEGTSTEFDGNSDYLEKSFTESTRTAMTFSAWLYVDTLSATRTILRNGATTAPYELSIQVTSTGLLNFSVVTGNQSKSAYASNKAFGFNQWHHILFSLNTTTGTGHLFIDDTDVGISASTTLGEDIKPLLNNFNIMKGNEATRPSGKVAHVYLDYTYRNFSVASNRRTFINADGSSTSPSTLSALNPVIYLPMTDAYSVGQNIGTGGNFTVNGSPTIVNSGTDFVQGEGGMTWIKRRTSADSHILTDSERGYGQILQSDTTGANQNLTSLFNLSATSSGFTIGSANTVINATYNDYASWTFRKAPKFFDVVTYTGDGNSTKVLSHNLGTTVGSVIIKCTNDSAQNWQVFHRAMSGTPNYSIMNLNTTASVTTVGVQLWDQSSTTFTVYANTGQNVSGKTYVAYLFAHNNGDGDFGPTGDQDIIKCGSYTGNGASIGPEIDLGFEPQFVIIKRTDASASWAMFDVMRGMMADGTGYSRLYPNLTNAEDYGTSQGISPEPTGFQIRFSGTDYNASGGNYIYIAIRRGPMAVPESATDVFTAAYQNSVGTVPGWTSGFPVDMSLDKNIGGGSTDDWAVGSRLTQGKYFYQIATTAEGTWSGMAYDFMDGWRDTANNGPSDFSWMWRRAPSFFDVVCWTGDGTSSHTINHNLGVAPEMIWVKRRNAAANWYVTADGLTNGIGGGNYILLNSTAAETYGSPTLLYNNGASSFDVANHALVNGSGDTYIAYLFASLDGISKVGSYTGNGSTQTINCGFTNGARFVLMKKYNTSGQWAVFDVARGITTSNTDGVLTLNQDWRSYTENEYTASNIIQPHSSGFQLVASTFNSSGDNYIFYAIA